MIPATEVDGMVVLLDEASSFSRAGWLVLWVNRYFSTVKRRSYFPEHDSGEVLARFIPYLSADEFSHVSPIVNGLQCIMPELTCGLVAPVRFSESLWSAPLARVDQQLGKRSQVGRPRPNSAAISGVGQLVRRTQHLS